MKIKSDRDLWRLFGLIITWFTIGFIGGRL